MMRSGSPLARGPASPAVSEISVGSPSPPLVFGPTNLSQHNVLTAFRPLSTKRARLSESRMLSAAPPTAERAVTWLINRQPAQPPPRRKSCAERVKSFTIADILGKRDGLTRSPSPRSPPAHSPTLPPQPLPAPSDFGSVIKSPPLSLLPRPDNANTTTLLPAQVLSDRLEANVASLVMPPSQLLLDAHGFPKASAHAWQSMRSAPATIPLHPFLPPALLHYEQRLAWDYQRQLQEHFHAQAQLLRQMSLDPSIIPSEDGSERSHSSSTGSDCCSPGLSAAPTTADDSSTAGNQGAERSGCVEAGVNDARKANVTGADGKTQKSAGDTPLDALFQLSTKNFDDGSDPATLNIFSTRPNSKKKRKSRTAFTNHQIFELEKRFLYQKYLSPADRDEIAAALGLSNAQVITWFQNRRAKLKRDIEELKKDVESVKELPDQSADISSQQQYQSACRQRLQQHQQHLMATLNNNHRNLAHHLLPISPLSCLQLQSPTQQQQYQQQHQHRHTNASREQSMMTYPSKSQPTLAEATVANVKERPPAIAMPAHPSQGCTNSTTAEDKKELKMLKMMTLMYYTSRAHADAASGDAVAKCGRAAGNGNSHQEGIVQVDRTTCKFNGN